MTIMIDFEVFADKLKFLVQIRLVPADYSLNSKITGSQISTGPVLIDPDDNSGSRWKKLVYWFVIFDREES